MNRRMLMPRLLLLLAVAAAALTAVGLALAAGSTAINWQVIAGGGAPSSGGNITLNDTLGQPIIGPASGGNVNLGAGYWYGLGNEGTLCGLVENVPYAFNQTWPVSVTLQAKGTIECLHVRRYDQDHPQAFGAPDLSGIGWGRYWAISATDSLGAPATGYTLTLSLPQTGYVAPWLCRYESGSGWDCGDLSYTTFTPSTVTRSHITSLSDWAVGNDVLPSISAIADQTTAEDTLSAPINFTVGDLETDPISLTLSAETSDPGLAPLSGITFGGAGAARSLTVLPAADQYGVVTITVTVADGFPSPSASASASFRLTVTPVNDAPVLTAVSNQTINELETLTFTVSATEVDPLDTLTYALTAVVPAGAGIDPVSGLFAWTPTEAQGPGVYTLTVQVADNGAPPLGDSQVFTVTVNEVNVAPIVDAGLNQMVNEGDLVAFSGSFNDPGRLAGETIHWDFGDGASATGALTPTHIYADNGVYTVTLTITDALGAAGQDTLVVTVNNLPPVLGALGDQTVQESAPLTVTVPYTDAGSADTQVVEIDWGDGAVTSGVVDPVNGTVSGSHVYTATGTYTLTITITDDDGGVGILTVQVEVTPLNHVIYIPLVVRLH